MFGNTPKIKQSEPTPTPPTPSNIEVEASKRSMQERMRRARGRESTQLTTPGTLYQPMLSRPELKKTL